MKDNAGNHQPELARIIVVKRVEIVEEIHSRVSLTQAQQSCG
jgi:hypothetical protein